MAKVEGKARRHSWREQGLRIISRPAPGPLGVYEVASGTEDRKGRRYKVTARDAGWRHASCDCTDYLTNELGTCKHIERVKLSLGPVSERKLKAAEERARRISIYLGSRPSHEKLLHALDEIRVHVPEPLRARVLAVLRAWTARAIS